MHILFATGIYPPDIGGPASYTRDFSQWLKRQGHTVSIVCYSDKPGTDVVRVVRAGSVLRRYWEFGKAVYQMAKQADVIYAQGPVSEGLPTMVAAFFARKPYVVKMVGDFAWEQAQQRGEKDLLDEFVKKMHFGKVGLMEWVERMVAKRAKTVITPSRYLKSIVTQWGVYPEHISVILNAQESHAHQQQESTTSTGVAYPRYNASSIICFTTARAVPWKGVKELIAWWHETPPTHQLVIAGSGPEAETWRQLIELSPAKERIVYRGSLTKEQMMEQYALSDVFLLDSGYEGYSHVIAEAASFGIPCFVSDKGGNPETKDQFGELIHIVPYLDKSAWLHELGGIQKRDLTIVPHMSPWTFDDMGKATLALLLNAIKL